MGLASFGVCANNVAQTDTLESVELKELSVVAIRANEKTPIAFTNVTSEELAKKNIGRDIPYLLSMTPSVPISATRSPITASSMTSSTCSLWVA